MPKIPVSPYWSENPSIPIYLDPVYERESSPPSKRIDEHICPTCETSSKDQSIHCISVSPAPSSSPPSYHSVIEAANRPSPRHLEVTVLNIQTPRRWSKPQPPLPALQFDHERRHDVRFRRNAFSPLTPSSRRDNDVDWDSKSSLGLGIPDAQFRPDRSPIISGTVETANDDRLGALGAASNFAQRIEQRLWKYSASRNVVKRWLLEIVSWLLSATCMAGILIMLFVYKDKRIPNWPLGLTLNAYISVLSKIASAGLLLPVSEALGQLKWSWFNKGNSKKMWDFEIFDNASRGPWGSLLLLVRTKGKSLAALGAAVTLFALAMDPFFQQVVEYPERWRIQIGTGTIPRATGYSPYGAGQEYRITGQTLVLDQNLLAVANRFFYDNGTVPITFGKGTRAEVPLSCPSSNCTWPQYETLGMCSTCTPIPDLLEFKCLNTTLDWIKIPDTDPDTQDTVFPNGTSCGYWLKADNPLLMSGYDVDRGTNHSGEVLLMRAQPLLDIVTRDPLPGYSAKLKPIRNPLAHIVIVSGRDVTSVQRNETPIAHECMVSWCVKDMLSEYSEEGYTETVNRTFVNSTGGPNPWVTFPFLNSAGEQEGIDYYYGENPTLTSPSGVIYEVNNFTQILTLSLFDDVFPSTYTIANSTDEADAILRYKQYILRNPWIRNMTHNPWMFANVSAHMDNMATAFTNLLRASEDHTEMIKGPAFDKESIVDVRWEWMALPLGLLGLTFLFLVATIIRSSMEQEQVGVYKTSAIATLLYGLPDGMQKTIAESNVDKTPRTNAKETKVKWVPRGGWRFSGYTLSPSSTKSCHSPSTEWT
jgi:hypothetical protein